MCQQPTYKFKSSVNAQRVPSLSNKRSRFGHNNMPMNPQPLMRTDTRLDLALDLKHNTTSPTTPRANGQPLFPLASNVGHKRPLKRTESIGKGGTVDMFNPTAPTQGSLLSNKLPTYSQDTKSTSIPVFTHPHEDDDNVGLDFGKWHFDAGEGSPLCPTQVAKLAPLAIAVPGLIF